MKFSLPPRRTLLLFLMFDLLVTLLSMILYFRFMMWTANNICQYYGFDYVVARENDDIICAKVFDNGIRGWWNLTKSPK